MSSDNVRSGKDMGMNLAVLFVARSMPVIFKLMLSVLICDLVTLFVPRLPASHVEGALLTQFVGNSHQTTIMLVMMTMVVAMMVMMVTMMVTMMVVVVGRTVMVMVVTVFNSSPHCHTGCHSQSCSPYTRSTLQRDINNHKMFSE